MEQHFTLTRVMIGDDDEPITSTSFTASDADAVNCAHMLAAGFNTMSRNFTNGWVLGVVDTEAGTVQYHGTIEQIKRPDPWSVSQSFTFETSADADTIMTLFGDGETPTFSAFGKFSFAETATDDEVLTKAADDLAKAAAGHIARSVLEESYVELQAVKAVLSDAGFETIPAEAGVRDLVHLNEQLPALAEDLADAQNRVVELERRDEFERHARQSMEAQHAQANESTRAELIEYTKQAYAKFQRIGPGQERDELIFRWRGMLDVFAKFLVATGEADADEGHALARRLCGFDDE